MAGSLNNFFSEMFVFFCWNDIVNFVQARTSIKIIVCTYFSFACLCICYELTIDRVPHRYAGLVANLYLQIPKLY